MRNLIIGLTYLSITLKITDTAIVPADKTYKVEQDDENVPIEWVYDHEESMLIVSWTFENLTSQSATPVMTQFSGAQAVPVAGYNIRHDQNGTILLQKITDEYLGIYYCTVTYEGVSGFTPVTGTATIELKEATTEEIYDCPGLGNSTAVDSEAECVCAWFGICCAILAGFFCNGICFGCILIHAKCCCDCFKKGEGCEDCVNNYYCRCECCASTPCGACCNIIRLPSWYQVLWASIIGIPIALGILLVWKCCGETNERGRNDSTNNSSGDVPLNTKYSN